MNTRARRVHLVVTCTNRKRQPPHPDLTIRAATDIAGRDPWKGWLRRIERVPSPVLEARELYLGQHWFLARGLATDLGHDLALTLWVCSAGYGLIGSAAPLKSYSAVFTSGSEDAVSRLMPGLDNDAAVRRWWNGLADWEGPTPGSPRTLAALVGDDPDAVIVLAVSPPYLTACRDDLRRVSSNIGDPDRVLVICPGRSRAIAPGIHPLPLDGRAAGFLGGTMGTLGVRFARHVLYEYDWAELRASLIRPKLGSWLESLTPRPMPARSRHSDEEVAGFIRKRLRLDSKLSPTRLLHEYRAGGHACEQGRFHTIYLDVREGNHVI